jgi:hypothetical protein
LKKSGDKEPMPSKIETVFDDLKDLYHSNYFDDEDNLSKKELKFKQKLIELCELIIEENEIEDDDDDADSYDRDFWGEA